MPETRIITTLYWEHPATAETAQPGEMASGIARFRHHGDAIDWSSAMLEMHPDTTIIREG